MNKPVRSQEFNNKLAEYLFEGYTFTPNYVGAKPISIAEACSISTSLQTISNMESHYREKANKPEKLEDPTNAKAFNLERADMLREIYQHRKSVMDYNEFTKKTRAQKEETRKLQIEAAQNLLQADNLKKLESYTPEELECFIQSNGIDIPERFKPGYVEPTNQKTGL